MSSTDLNNEDHFSDYPKRLPCFDLLIQTKAQLSPEHFFRNLERQSGDNHFSQHDYLRALSLFRRLQSARRTISKLILFLVAVSLVPFVCVALHFLKNGGQALLRAGLCWSFLPGRSFTSRTHDGKPGAETIVCG
jgi:hypothetical protein